MPWAPAPTLAGSARSPRIHARHVWPSHHFDLEPEVLYTDLHQRFNTTPMFIQDFDSFYADVNEIAHEAENQADLYRRLEIRRDQRLEEVRDAMHRLRHHPNYWDAFKSKDFGNFRQLMRYATLDHLVRLLASLLESRNRSPPVPCRFSSPTSEDLMEQPVPDEVMGIGPEYDSDWTWETSAEREKRMQAEGKITRRQAPTETTEDLPKIKAEGDQDDAEHNGTAMPRHDIQKLGRQLTEPAEEPRPGKQHRAKKRIKTTPISGRNRVTAASEKSQLQESQTTSTRTPPFSGSDEAEGRESNKKRKRAIDDEQDVIETEAQPNGEPSPRRQVKARKAKSTSTASATAERPKPRRSARLSSSK